MGVLNCTPDSFSDGGRFDQPAAAVARALEMEAQGADLIDIGGESTRPGARPVTADQELARVGPVLEALAGRLRIPLSIDTRKAAVARVALAAGARIINDISALTADPAMPALARDSGAGVILMHMQGQPETMQTAPAYTHAPQDVRAWLAARVDACLAAGLAPEQLALDPGIGFGKRLEHNLALLAHLPELRIAGRPLAVGVSRKRFLGELTGREVGGRLAGSLGAAAWAALHGADMLRVHDVEETCDLLTLVARIAREEALS
ncbi:MAG: dihydropteroate synthase [Candidatus Marinimicrobia bacterium]|nr:dihydropteroate synthase [Candidatus Neomarinimicrobiota bacterium]